MTDIYETVRRAYSRSVPILAINTPDCAATSRRLSGVLDGVSNGKHAPPLVGWDCVRCAFGINHNGKVAVEAFGEEPYTVGEMIDRAGELPTGSIVVVFNAHLFLESPQEKQAIWNIRDKWKADRKMLVLLGPSVIIPRELQHDVIGLDEPLPDVDTLKGIVGSIYDMAKVNQDAEVVSRSADSLRGVSAFAAEQIAAINLERQGMSVPGLWESKRKKIDDTPGLQVIANGTFENVAGVNQAKKFLGGVLTGNDRPGCIVFIDEIEKAFGGSSSDTSGVSQDQLGVVLSWMQDRQASGCIFVGPPGAAKSALAKNAGGDHEVPTVQLDLGAMKGSLVGASEGMVREALKVVDGMSGGKTLWLATCNSIASLPPELKRRFRLGTWYFDLPDREEREAIWSLYCDRYGHDYADAIQLLDREYTGAEIESCCDIAWRISTTLDEASQYIVPVSVSASDTIKSLRQMASGRTLDAHRPGVYRQETREEVRDDSAGRVLSLD